MNVPPVAKRPLEVLVAPDGTGDYATLPAARAALAPGGVIRLKGGTYPPFSAAVTIDKACRIVGDARFATKLQAPVTVAGDNCFNVTHDDVAFEHLEIDGRRAAQTGAGSTATRTGIWLDTVQRCRVENCHLHDFRGMAIAGQYADHTEIRGCRIENHATSETWGEIGSLKGIYFERTGYALIEDNYLTGWSQGIGLWVGCHDCRVLVNRLIDNLGFENDGPVLGNISRSACEDFGTNVVGAGRNHWHGNLVDGSTHCCMEAGNGGDSGCQYTNNTWKRAGLISNAGSPFQVVGGGGIPDADERGVLVSGNHCYGSGGSTINDQCVFAPDSQGVLIGNFFFDFVYQAAVDVNCPSAYIAGNQFRGCHISLWLSGTDMSVVGNQIESALSGNPLGIYVVAGGEIALAQNRINVPNGTGIRFLVDALPGVQVHGGHITANIGVDCPCGGQDVKDARIEGAAAIIFSGASSVGNWVDGCRLAGVVQLSGGATDNRVTENRGIGGAVNIQDTSGGSNTTAPNYS